MLHIHISYENTTTYDETRYRYIQSPNFPCSSAAFDFDNDDDDMPLLSCFPTSGIQPNSKAIFCIFIKVSSRSEAIRI